MARVIKVSTIWEDEGKVLPQMLLLRFDDQLVVVGKKNRSLNLVTGEVGVITEQLRGLETVELLTEDEINDALKEV